MAEIMSERTKFKTLVARKVNGRVRDVKWPKKRENTVGEG